MRLHEVGCLFFGGLATLPELTACSLRWSPGSRSVRGWRGRVGRECTFTTEAGSSRLVADDRGHTDDCLIAPRQWGFETRSCETSSMSLRGTPRGRENGVGSPVDADRFLGRMSPQTSLAPGPDLEGSRIVASSTPVRISVPLTEAPGRPTRWNRTDSIGGQAEMGARRKTKQKPAMENRWRFPTPNMSW